jgi:hypothetical protein
MVRLGFGQDNIMPFALFRLGIRRRFTERAFGNQFVNPAVPFPIENSRKMIYFQVRYSNGYYETIPVIFGVELVCMVVRIRFRRGPLVERRKGKNSRIAWVVAGLLTLGSVSCLVLGIWRLGVDFGWAGDFVFPDGYLLSHWQIWLAAALAIQVAAWKLNQYGTPKVAGAHVEGPQKRTEKKVTASA